MTNPAAKGRRRSLALAIAILAALASVPLGLSTQRAYLLLRSAREAGAPATSAIRAWMTLDYVAGAYGVRLATLVQRLALPDDTSPQETLKSLASKTGVARFAFVQRVQKAVASAAPAPKPAASSGWLASFADSVLSVVLTFGYPGYALVRFLGSAGAPLPDSVATILAGSLAGQGRFDFWAAVALGGLAAGLGDLASYAIGRRFGPHLIATHGAKIGLTTTRRTALAEALDRWGVWAVLVTRTLAASLGGLVDIVAGASGYPIVRFLASAAAGRMAWTLACVGLGYSVGADIDAAAGFLRSFASFSLSVFIFGVAAFVWKQSSPPCYKPDAR